MTEEKWKLVWDLYRNARSVPVAQRASFVKAAIDDSAIAGEVLALLSSQSSSGETPVGVVARVAAIESGRRIGRYTVKRMLGRGGMGETWSAQDMELERTVALKFLRQAAPQDSSSAERFIREARAASALNHPNIVTVFEVVRSEQDLAIAMELVDGEGLRGLCGTPQPVARVLRIGEQIAEALAAAHAANILHRDIKPENLIVRSDGYVKVLDFGLARRLDAGTITHPGMPAGTFRYMSPEQSRGQRLTAGSDVFSLGVVLFELVAGSHPFPAESALEAMMAIGSAEPKWLADVSPGTPRDLAKVIGTMLAKDPAARPSAGSIAGRLREIRQELSQSGDSQPAKALALRRRSAVKYGLAALPAAALGVYGWRHFSKVRPGSFEAVPFEGDRGLSHASEPAFSPDGRTVAYVARVPADPPNIWAKPLTGAPVQLTFGNAEKGSPVWSPDGASIAFIQMTGLRLAEIRIIPAAGGPSRKLVEILSPQAGHLYFPGPSLCWSPDPSWLAVSCRQSPQDSYSLFLVHIETGETRQLTDSTGSEHGDSCPSFSPDGKTLAFSRLDWANRLYVVPIDSRMNSAGPPRLLETGKPWNASPAWTADGKELIASCGMSNPKLMRISPWLDRAPEALSGVGESGWFPAVSRTRGDNRLIYVKRLLATGMWRLDLTVRGGVPVAAREPVKIIPAEAENFEPMWAPDSQRFAFTSSRSGYRELWVSDRDGAMPVQVDVYASIRRLRSAMACRWTGDVLCGEGRTQRRVRNECSPF